MLYLEPAAEFNSTSVLLYAKGVSEPLRRCLQQQGTCAFFKTDTTLRTHLVRHCRSGQTRRHSLRIPCECGKVYIGETGRSMQERIKSMTGIYDAPCTQTSAVSEYANKIGHHPLWNEAKFIDRDSHWYTRRVNEAVQHTTLP